MAGNEEQAGVTSLPVDNRGGTYLLHKHNIGQVSPHGGSTDTSHLSKKRA